jgi:hypothetical protein
LGVPVGNALDQQVHPEVLDERSLVEGLQKKARLSVPDICEVFR